MKKRKPPVVLATCLVILLISVGIFFAPQGAGHAHEEAAPQPQAEQGDRPTMTTDQVSSMASGAMKTQTLVPNKPGAKTGGPSVLVPKQVTTKPKPSESSTSTQWYIDQTKK